MGLYALLRPVGVEITIPSSCIHRKVTLYPEPDNLTDSSFYICMDYPVTNVRPSKKKHMFLVPVRFIF